MWRQISRRAAILGWRAAVPLLAVMAFLPAPARAEQPRELSTGERTQLFELLAREAEALESRLNVVKSVVKLASPSVVHIEWQKRRSSRAGGRTVEIEEAGSGVVMQLGDQFYVITNWHVIRDAEIKEIKIVLADGRLLTPLKRWWDQATDVAVIAVQETDLVPVRVGDSDRLEMGDFVLAVGSPFGLSHSVTYGIISAKGRRDLELPNDDLRYQDFLQTDAAINPGNSGGPLFDLRGELIGINTAIASSSGGNEGIGFTIPINMVMTVARQLIERGRVVRAYLGVRMDRDFDPATAARLGLSRPRGALVSEVQPNSGAALAGLQVEDVILEFNHVPIDDDDHLGNVVSLTEVGTVVPVVVLRARQELTVDVRVGSLDEQQNPGRRKTGTTATPNSLDQGTAEPPAAEPLSEAAPPSEEAWDVDVLGLTLIELDQLGEALPEVPGGGLYVSWVNPHGPAAGVIAPGEVLDRLEATRLVEIEDLEGALSIDPLPAVVRAHVIDRDGTGRTVHLELGEPTAEDEDAVE